MLNVAYFSNQFADRDGHGLARYSRELFKALQKCSSDVALTPTAAWSGNTSDKLSELKSNYGLQILPWGRRLTPLSWAVLDRPPIEYWLPHDIDVVHAVAMGYPIATRKPLVVTVHDLGPITHPQYFQFKGTWIMKRSLAQTIAQAKEIICVSKSTAKELTRIAGDSIASRISIVPEGVSASFFEPPHTNSLNGLRGLPPSGAPFILSTGKLSPRKNIQGLIEAMVHLSTEIPHHLVLVGGDGWSTKQLHAQIAHSPIRERVHMLDYVTDDQLRALYRAAAAYVHPSHYEGFGLTVLEAMASGCPVVTSNVYSLPEVAGDAALLVSPTKSEDIAGAIKDICTDDALTIELKNKGIARAADFRWSRCAEQVSEIYRRAAER